MKPEQIQLSNRSKLSQASGPCSTEVRRCACNAQAERPTLHNTKTRETQRHFSETEKALLRASLRGKAPILTRVCASARTPFPPLEAIPHFTQLRSLRCLAQAPAQYTKVVGPSNGWPIAKADTTHPKVIPMSQN